MKSTTVKKTYFKKNNEVSIKITYENKEKTNLLQEKDMKHIKKLMDKNLILMNAKL